MKDIPNLQPRGDSNPDAAGNIIHTNPFCSGHVDHKLQFKEKN